MGNRTEDLITKCSRRNRRKRRKRRKRKRNGVGVGGELMFGWN
jgi:hypothetical protein